MMYDGGGKYKKKQLSKNLDRADIYTAVSDDGGGRYRDNYLRFGNLLYRLKSCQEREVVRFTSKYTNVQNI